MPDLLEMESAIEHGIVLAAGMFIFVLVASVFQWLSGDPD